MQRSDFLYKLPEELIAQYPPEQRGESRLLCLDANRSEVKDKDFEDLITLIKPGDLFVFNNTRVIPARLFAKKASGGRVEILVERLLDDGLVLALIRASKTPKPGTRLLLENGGDFEVISRMYHRDLSIVKFEVLAEDGAARRGRMTFVSGIVHTPVFMPVGTYGTVKSMIPEELSDIGSEIILGNTFHLMLRPGIEIIELHGGLHEFMNWSGPILTDSGGFQVFSLAKSRKISEDGVHFRSPINGDEVFFGPEQAIAIQHSLNTDIIMIFDDCTPYPSTEEQVRASMQLSLRWARRSKAAHDNHSSALFRVVCLRTCGTFLCNN